MQIVAEELQKSEQVLPTIALLATKTLEKECDCEPATASRGTTFITSSDPDFQVNLPSPIEQTEEDTIALGSAPPTPKVLSIQSACSCCWTLSLPFLLQAVYA